MQRRAFIQSALWSGTGLLLYPKLAWAFGELLPTPDFAIGPEFKIRSGLRPGRHQSVRIELEKFGDRLMAHNYGHSGAGITTSWGSAYEVLDLLRSAQIVSGQIAVLGAGVIGMTTAMLLAENGFDVRIYSHQLTPNTTSDVAGGQFGPAGIQFVSRDQRERMLRRSFNRFVTLLGDDYGVYRRDNYTTIDSGRALEKIPRDLVPKSSFDRLPFAGSPKAGHCYQTLLIEPPRFLARLLEDLREAGVEIIEERRFQDLDDVLSIPEGAMVNCLGLAAGKIFNDALVHPIRGQIVLLKAQELPYLLSHDGYIFPRHDGLLLGGTWEPDIGVNEPDPETCRQIVLRNQSFFA
jgi:D-amino-acid oxidase